MAARSDRVARRQGLEHDLRRYEQRAHDMQQLLEGARSAHKKTQANLALVTTRAANAEDECASIRRLLAFDPEVVDRLPCELLQAIFVQVFAITDWQSIEKAEYDRARSLVPYQLGAVCRHWRRVVRDTPELWTYIALPPWLLRHRRFFADYVERNLEMSRSRSLQLCVSLIELDIDRPERHWLFDTLATLVTHMGRWGRVKLVFTRSWLARISSILSMGRSGLLLKEVFLQFAVSLAIRDLLVTTLDAAWLSGARNLRLLHADNITLGLGLAYAFPCLQSVTLDVIYEAGFDVLKKILQQAPRVQKLLFRLFWMPDSASESALVPSCFPALESLTVRGSHPAVERVTTRLVIAPQLRELSINPPSAERDVSWGQGYVAAFAGVTDLEFVGDDGYLGAAQAMTFGRLNHVRRLSFSRCAFPGESINGDPHSFWRKATLSGPDKASMLMWPELESLELSSYAGGVYRAHVLDELCYFVHVRCAAYKALGKRFRLTLARWPVDAFPLNYALAFAQTLGPDNVRLETRDGCVQSVNADDGVWDRLKEEKEARFVSDCDEGSECSRLECDDDSDDPHSDGRNEGALSLGNLCVNGPDWEEEQTDSSNFVASGDSDLETSASSSSWGI